MNNPEITQVVLTGGPCSGKSTAIAKLRTTFEDRGINVVTVPETATHLFGGMGAKIGDNLLSVDYFQELLTEFQVSQEKTARKIAEYYQGKTLIILDRWILDTKAYTSPEMVKQALAWCGLTEQEVLSNRYDAVIHLVTAADGAEGFYTLANNAVRTETAEQARALDMRLKQAYVGSPKIQVIDNSTAFDGKLRRVEESISHILWIPQPLEIENKYLIRITDMDALMKVSRSVDIEQTYIQLWDIEERVRMRSMDGIGHTYYHTLKRPYGNARIETERIISPEEYEQIVCRGVRVIRKKRSCFLYENQYFELDRFVTASRSFEPDTALLEIELVKEWQEVNFPPFLEEIADVTHDPDYKNQNLAVPV